MFGLPLWAGLSRLFGLSLVTWCRSILVFSLNGNTFSPDFDPHRQRRRRQKLKASWSSLALKTKRSATLRMGRTSPWQERAITRSSTLALTIWVKATATMRAPRQKRRRPRRQLQLWLLWAPARTVLTPATLRTARPAVTQVSDSVWAAAWLRFFTLSVLSCLCWRGFSPQMLLTFLTTPVLVTDRRDAQGNRVTGPRTLEVVWKRSSVDPKR